MTREEFCRKAADIRYYDEIIAEYDRLVGELESSEKERGELGAEVERLVTVEAKLARAQAALRYYWDADHVKGWPTPCTCDFCTRFPQALEELG